MSCVGLRITANDYEASVLAIWHKTKVGELPGRNTRASIFVLIICFSVYVILHFMTCIRQNLVYCIYELV